MSATRASAASARVFFSSGVGGGHGDVRGDLHAVDGEGDARGRPVDAEAVRGVQQITG
jgi:hypothetical protein